MLISKTLFNKNISSINNSLQNKGQRMKKIITHKILNNKSPREKQRVIPIALTNHLQLRATGKE